MLVLLPIFITREIQFLTFHLTECMFILFHFSLEPHDLPNVYEIVKPVVINEQGRIKRDYSTKENKVLWFCYSDVSSLVADSAYGNLLRKVSDLVSVVFPILLFKFLISEDAFWFKWCFITSIFSRKKNLFRLTFRGTTTRGFALTFMGMEEISHSA